MATRMIAGMWFFFTLLMVSSYTANLAAFLTTERPDPHFTDLKELVKNADEKGIKYGAKKGGATENFFQEKARMEPDSEFAKAWEHMQKYSESVMVLENDDGVSKAQMGYYAFFMETTSIEYEAQRKCDLHQVGKKLDEKSYGIAMKKNSTYRHTLSNAILSLQQSGKIDEIKKRWWEERRGGGQCAKSGDSEEANALNLKGVEGVFWVTIGGVIVALFFAVLETLIAIGKKAVKLRTSYWSVLKDEVKFYLRFNEMEKQVVYPEDSVNSTPQGNKGETLSWVNKECSVETLASNNSNRSKRSRSRRSRSKRSKSGKKNVVKQNSENSC